MVRSVDIAGDLKNAAKEQAMGGLKALQVFSLMDDFMNKVDSSINKEGAHGKGEPALQA